MTERRNRLTTVKVSTQTAAIISVTVRRLKAQGRKDLTADSFLMELMQQNFPEDARYILKDYETDDAQPRRAKGEKSA